MDIQKSSVSEFRAGRFAVTDTPQRLPAFQAVKGVRIKNVGSTAVLVGSYALEPRESVSIPIDSADKVPIRTESGTSAISFLVV